MCILPITIVISREAALLILPLCSTSCVPIVIRVTLFTSAAFALTILRRPIRILSLICVNAKDDQRDECFNTFAPACRHYWCRAGRGQSACLVLLHAQ